MYNENEKAHTECHIESMNIENTRKRRITTFVRGEHFVMTLCYLRDLFFYTHSFGRFGNIVNWLRGDIWMRQWMETFNNHHNIRWRDSPMDFKRFAYSKNPRKWIHSSHFQLYSEGQHFLRSWMIIECKIANTLKLNTETTNFKVIGRTSPRFICALPTSAMMENCTFLYRFFVFSSSMYLMVFCCFCCCCYMSLMDKIQHNRHRLLLSTLKYCHFSIRISHFEGCK